MCGILPVSTWDQLTESVTDVMKSSRIQWHVLNQMLSKQAIMVRFHAYKPVIPVLCGSNTRHSLEQNTHLLLVYDVWRKESTTTSTLKAVAHVTKKPLQISWHDRSGDADKAAFKVNAEHYTAMVIYAKAHQFPQRELFLPLSRPSPNCQFLNISLMFYSFQLQWIFARFHPAGEIWQNEM